MANAAPTPEQVAQSLREARAKSRKTQAQIAEECGVTQPVVHLWESGERLPKTADVRTVAKAYGLRPEQLLPAPASAA